MPNIVIKEIDKTSAGIGLYTNFTVLVPGFVKNSVAGVFDENGVCELSKQSEFVTKIGKVAAKIVVAPTVPIVVNKKLTLNEYKSLVTNDDETTQVFTSIVNPDPTDIGELRDANCIYNEVVEENPAALTQDNPGHWRPSAVYSIIKPNERGEDGTEIMHYGNQIAYELLGLGYTVLYKELDKTKPLSATLENNSWWEELKDRSAYDFRYVISGLIDKTKNANEAIRSLVHFLNESPKTGGRGDCVALLDLPRSSYDNKTQAGAIDGIKSAIGELKASKYTALFAPCVTYNMKEDDEYGKNMTFPASFHYLACAARAAENFNEWYAIAGYTRGISDYSIAGVGCKFGEAAVDAFQPRRAVGNVNKAVNLIIKIKNNYYLWGNRTAHLLKAEETADLQASHFLNIRQLCTTLKKQIYITCRQLTFDPNSDVLWINFCNAIRPLLERMKADQGIEDYKFVKIKSKQKAMLKAKIRIVPIEAVEDFDISLTLEDSISGLDVEIDDKEDIE